MNNKINHRLIATYLCLFATGVHGYNIETRAVNIITPRDVQNNSWFGYSMLLQPESNGKLSIYASSPLYKKNFTTTASNGAIHKCFNDEKSKDSFSCEKMDLDDTSSFGMSMVQTKDNKLVVCGPQWEYQCRNAHIPKRMVGSCYVLNSSDVSNAVPEKLPSPCVTDCPGGLDIVFLVDSSGSVTEENFNQTKDWLVAIMEGFREGMKHGEVNVGVIQYSGTTDSLLCETGVLRRLISIELPLGSYDLEAARAKVMESTRLRKCTLTGDAINATVDEFLLHGRKENAAVMIVITDGRSSDDVTGPSNHAKQNDINMLAVGVGEKFVMSELEIIANNNLSIFTVESFANLNSILTDLQQAILLASTSTLEGSSGNSTTELTQCLMGMSAYISEENNLHLGAIGANDNKGTIISRFMKDIRSTHVLPEELVKRILPMEEEIIKDSYLGYSITGGHFTGPNIEWIATGIPRYFNHGGVVLYRTNVSDIYNPHLLLPPFDYTSNRHVGTYFGHTLCAVDLNIDEADELIVGAPLHSEAGTHSYDEGCVFIYYGNKSAGDISFMTKPACTLHGFLPSSRFGMSIIGARNLDKDEYNDFVVGAPGANDQTGEIVVYYGSNNCSTMRYQRISPSSFGLQLQYFGYSIASVDDTNFSRNPIIIASSPKSQQIVAIKARPVIELLVDLTINSQHGSSIDVIQCAKDQTNKIPCGKAVVCFQVNWKDVGQQTNNEIVDLSFDLTLDSDFEELSEKRMVFEGNETTSFVIAESNHPSQTRKTCNEYKIILQPNILIAVDTVDFSQPMHATLTTKLSERVQREIMSPVMAVEQITVKKEMLLTKGCTTNGSCLYDLSLSADIPEDDPFLINDASEVMDINITVVNNGDSAFFTKLQVDMWNIVIVHVKSECAFLETDRQTISYRDKIFGSLHMTGQSCQLGIRFSVIPLAKFANETEMKINITAFSLLSKDTKAKDVTPSNNIIVINKNVVYRSSFTVNGLSIPDAMQYWRNITNMTSASSLSQKGIFAGEDGNIENSYKIRNTGPFTVTTTNMTFTWPAFTATENLPLLYLYSFTCKPESLCTCSRSDQCDFINPHKLPYNNLTVHELHNVTHCPAKRNFTIYSSELNITQPETFYVIKNDMMCDKPNSIFKCNEISCHVNNIKPNQVVEINGRFKFWIPTFRFKENDEDTKVYIGSSLTFNPTKSPVFPSTIYKESAITTTQQYLKTRVTPKPPEQKVNLVTVLIAMFVGLAIVGLCTLICWKCGFFESRYKDMKEAVLEEEEEELFMSLASDNQKQSKKNGKEKQERGESSIKVRFMGKRGDGDASSVIDAAEEFVRATSSPSSAKKLSIPKDDLYLEMTPMRNYRAQKRVFQANVNDMLDTEPTPQDYSYICKEEEDGGKMRKTTMTIKDQKKQRVDSTRF
ncbi:integrin alpha-1-like isoform X2 [Styela clava]